MIEWQPVILSLKVAFVSLVFVFIFGVLFAYMLRRWEFPGKAAIEAALYPDETLVKQNYLYFCLGDPSTGETLFQKTLQEHNAAQAKYEPLWIAYQQKHMQG